MTGGRLGDRYGRRRVFFAGMAAFTLASAASGLAPTSGVLVIARLVQGAAAAMMVPLTCLFGLRSVPESRSPTRPSLDLRGVALLTLAAGLLIIPIAEGGALGWPLWCWLFLAAVPLSGAAFAWWEHRVRVWQPLVDLVLFRSRDFRRGLFVNVTLYATITSFFFVLGLYLQTGRGDSPMVAGLTFVPLAAGNFLASLSSGALVGRYGRGTLTAGAAFQAAGLLVLLAASSPGQPTALVLAGVTLLGLGHGLLIPPIIGVVLSRVPVADPGAPAGVLVTVQQMSGTIGLALVSLGFFAAVGSGQTGGYVAGFRVACLCDLALALGTLTLTRLLAPGNDRGG